MSDRYRRQISFSKVGLEGQQRIAAARVAIVGVGALGSMVAERLCRCGVGLIRLIDRDWVEVDNLPRQTLYNTADAQAKSPKAVAAKTHLQTIAPEAIIEAFVCDLTYRNANELLSGVDCIIDGTDNFETRYLINDLAAMNSIPWVHAGVLGASGQLFAIHPGQTACLRCLMPNPPGADQMQTCDSVGVLGPAVGIIASWQAMEAIKILLRSEQACDGAMRVFDLWSGNVRNVKVPRDDSDPGCRCCVQHQYDFASGRSRTDTKVLCGRNSVQLQPAADNPLDLRALKERLSKSGSVAYNPYFIRFSIDSHELSVFKDGRAIIYGTENPDEARKIYARWIGG